MNRFFFVLFFVFVIGFFWFVSYGQKIEPVVCTMEAKQCPDGSYVGRDGPECEFKACPSSVEAPAPTAEAGDVTLPEKIKIPVAYVSEAPEGHWVKPWVNACEESTITMMNEYYKGNRSVTVADAKYFIQTLFVEEDRLFGTNGNADSSQIMELINKYTEFSGRIETNPTIGDIKQELASGRPVISFHRGFDLKNPNIEFAPTLSSYHVMAIVGYDDAKQVFITHDPGDKVDGINHLYKYDLFMNSLHDFNSEDNKADGAPTVIFTSPI